VLTLVLAGLDMHQAATTGQFILFTTALAASIVFNKHRFLSIKLAIFIGGFTAVMAFVGGFTAGLFTGITLKIIFSILLVIAGVLMLLPVKEQNPLQKPKFGYWRLKSSGNIFIINLWLSIPIILATGFFAGMVGVSGGSFLVPLMVLACGVPMRIAVGTALALVAVIAFAGFLGHTLQGNFNATWAIPIATVAIIGGIIGGKVALRTKPTYLKTLFAITTLIAAIIMIVNVTIAK